MVREKTNFGAKEFLLLLGATVATEKALGGGFEMITQGPVGTTSLQLLHLNESSEGSDFKDGEYLYGGSPKIDMYSKVSFNPYRLKMDSRPADSTSNYLVEISGRDLVGTENVNMGFNMGTSGGQDNFSRKNLIVELYNAGDINNPANKLGTFDAHDLKNEDVSFPQLQVNNGLSYQIVVRPRNMADFNLDNKVNLRDKGILYKSWLSTDPNAANMWKTYTDINRNKVVDVNDLILFAPEWLFQGCDPNTFVKSNYINQLGPLLKDRPKLVKGSGLESGLNANSDIYEDRKARLRRAGQFPIVC